VAYLYSTTLLKPFQPTEQHLLPVKAFYRYYENPVDRGLRWYNNNVQFNIWGSYAADTVVVRYHPPRLHVQSLRGRRPAGNLKGPAGAALFLLTGKLGGHHGKFLHSGSDKPDPPGTA
jgi:hypothetical protein